MSGFFASNLCNRRSTAHSPPSVSLTKRVGRFVASAVVVVPTGHTPCRHQSVRAAHPLRTGWEPTGPSATPSGRCHSRRHPPNGLEQANKGRGYSTNCLPTASDTWHGYPLLGGGGGTGVLGRGSAPCRALHCSVEKAGTRRRQDPGRLDQVSVEVDGPPPAGSRPRADLFGLICRHLTLQKVHV